MTSLTWPICSPRLSAAIWVITVRVPVPRSCVPISTETDPSGLMTVRQLLAWPLPFQAAKPTPRPRLTGPDEPCRGGATASSTPTVRPLCRVGSGRSRLGGGSELRVGLVHLDRVHADFGSEILDGAASEVRRLLVARRAPGSLCARIHRNRSADLPYVRNVGEDVRLGRGVDGAEAAGAPGKGIESRNGAILLAADFDFGVSRRTVSADHLLGGAIKERFNGRSTRLLGEVCSTSAQASGVNLLPKPPPMYCISTLMLVAGTFSGWDKLLA